MDRLELLINLVTYYITINPTHHYQYTFIRQHPHNTTYLNTSAWKGVLQTHKYTPTLSHVDGANSDPAKYLNGVLVQTNRSTKPLSGVLVQTSSSTKPLSGVLVQTSSSTKPLSGVLVQTNSSTKPINGVLVQITVPLNLSVVYWSSCLNSCDVVYLQLLQFL